MSDSKLKLLQGPDAEAALSGDGVRVYGYILNRPALILLTVMAIAFYGLGALVWWQQGLDAAMWIVAFISLCGIGAAFSISVLYWQNFAKTRLVAHSDDYLFIGSRDSVWQIHWELLDLESLGVSQMELSKLSGRMTVKVGAERIPLDIFRGFVVLDDVPTFILAVLEKLDPELVESLKDEAEAQTEVEAEELG